MKVEIVPCSVWSRTYSEPLQWNEYSPILDYLFLAKLLLFRCADGSDWGIITRGQQWGWVVSPWDRVRGHGVVQLAVKWRDNKEVVFDVNMPTWWSIRRDVDFCRKELPSRAKKAALDEAYRMELEWFRRDQHHASFNGSFSVRRLHE